MRFLQRLNDQQHTRASNNGDTGASDLLQRVRSEGEGLLAAGDDAIQRALAGNNSEAFLRASRQQGGE